MEEAERRKKKSRAIPMTRAWIVVAIAFSLPVSVGDRNYSTGVGGFRFTTGNAEWWWRDSALAVAASTTLLSC
ncbi:hypothetical protein EJ110_NYTH19779 [Nymphaea thermarum]|nr:hypothetical protein EJ110_NYTH19779 [Nymphaea thermarum]